MNRLACLLISASLVAPALSPLAARNHDGRGQAELRLADVRLPFDLASRMLQHHVPGLGIAILDQGRIVAAQSFGTVEANGAPVGLHTRFQAGSLSKMITAATALRLVHAGALALDAPINRSLRNWQLPDGSFPAAAVTLRRLLGHSAGVGVPGFRGYEAGEAIPTLSQVLDGAAPANSPPVRIVAEPGRAVGYSGGGYVVVQKAIADQRGGDFAAEANRMVRAVGMTDSLFATEVPSSGPGSVAAGYDRMGQPIAGRWHLFAELGAAGLWSTPVDLATFAAWLMAGYRHRGSATQQFVASAMLTAQAEAGAALVTPAGNHAGLGLVLDGEGAAFHFSHAGSNPGQKAYVIGFPQTGQGAVIMANGDAAPALIQEIIRALATAYGWPDRLEPANPARVAAAPPRP
jgi:CubicO group peptidase (beta-lactamase class C family)